MANWISNIYRFLVGNVMGLVPGLTEVITNINSKVHIETGSIKLSQILITSDKSRLALGAICSSLHANSIILLVFSLREDI